MSETPTKTDDTTAIKTAPSLPEGDRLARIDKNVEFIVNQNKTHGTTLSALQHAHVDTQLHVSEHGAELGEIRSVLRTHDAQIDELKTQVTGGVAEATARTRAETPAVRAPAPSFTTEVRAELSQVHSSMHAVELKVEQSKAQRYLWAAALFFAYLVQNLLPSCQQPPRAAPQPAPQVSISVGTPDGVSTAAPSAAPLSPKESP